VVEPLDEKEVIVIRTRLDSSEMTGRDFGAEQPLNRATFLAPVFQ